MGVWDVGVWDVGRVVGGGRLYIVGEDVAVEHIEIEER